MNKDKVYSFIFSATAAGIFTLGGWLVLVIGNGLLHLMGG